MIFSLHVTQGCSLEEWSSSVDQTTDHPVDSIDTTGEAADVPEDCLDSDDDGVCDPYDRCPGYPDHEDGDHDGVPDGCDTCPGGDDGIDSDGDTVPDYCDCDGTGVECDENATCFNTEDGPVCECNEGYEGDGYTCTPIDHCASGTHTCHTNAVCIYTGPGTYDCVCNAGYEGDGFTCTPIDHCAAGTDLCDTNAMCTYTGPGTYNCTCNPGYTGDGYTCTPTAGPGHAVLIGHDYYLTNTAVSNIVGNAVFMSTTTGPVSVLAYTQYADTALNQEVENTDQAIDDRAAALGRSWTRTVFTDHTALSSSLPGHDVLLVYEQEFSTATAMGTVGAAWASTLDTFVRSGGVVVVCDYNGGAGSSFEILNSSGLMIVTAASIITTGTTVSVIAPSDPVALDVSSTYSASNGSVGFTTSETGVVTQVSSTRPVVIHKEFP